MSNTLPSDTIIAHCKNLTEYSSILVHVDPFKNTADKILTAVAGIQTVLPSVIASETTLTKLKNLASNPNLAATYRTFIQAFLDGDLNDWC